MKPIFCIQKMWTFQFSIYILFDKAKCWFLSTKKKESLINVLVKLYLYSYCHFKQGSSFHYRLQNAFQGVNQDVWNTNMWKFEHPGGSNSKESACNVRRPGFNPWVGKIPWIRECQPTPVFLPGEFHGLGSLVGYGPWGCKESVVNERPTHAIWIERTL